MQRTQIIDILRAGLIVVACFSMICATTAIFPTQLPSREPAGFVVVNDLPVVPSLQQYYELVDKGKTTVHLGGEDVSLFKQDLSYEDLQNLQLMLRTP